MVVPRWSLLCTPGPHSMLVENRSFSLREQRTLCGALNLRQHEIASSYTCDWPTRKCSTHPIIITIKRPYFNNRLRPKFVLFPLFRTTFAHTTLSWVRGNGRDRLFPDGTAIFLKKYLRKHWTGSGENSKIILSATLVFTIYLQKTASIQPRSSLSKFPTTCNYTYHMKERRIYTSSAR